ncbi:CHAT domain-containing protein [Actinoplanes sichuanensis]|uniref:CHAT domain-containing protein n=1 Tax=Actinoplanes sichuanensis TaxID=512349 RepID=A0ABW4AUM9_9ACTN|nr:CHAT domain-containing protein [Actinoplanes sichuanensis]
MIFVPHKALHALPLHALVLDAETDLYLHDVVNSVRFCSSLFDASTSGTWVPPPGYRQPTPRLVSVMERDSPLPGVGLYRRMLDVLRLQLGEQMRIDDLYGLGDLPGGFELGDIRVNWHGHGRSSSNAWGASYLTLGDGVVFGRTIATTWRLPGRPHVVLASCQSAVDAALTSVVDEYCGLDVAFRIAGARSVAASMWDLGDPVAAFTAVRLTSSFLQTGKPPAHALTALQRAFRNGTWKAALLRPEQAAALPTEQAELLREFQAPLRTAARRRLRRPPPLGHHAGTRMTLRQEQVMEPDADDWFEIDRRPPWPDYLPPAVEIGKWTSGVLASGVLGNASYDGLKALTRWLRRRNEPGPIDCSEVDMQAALEALAKVSARQRAVQLGFAAPLTALRVTSIAGGPGATTATVTGPAFRAEVRLPHDDLTAESIEVTVRGIAPPTPERDSRSNGA